MIFDPCSLQRRGGHSYRQGWSERVPYETCVSGSWVNWRARYGCTVIDLVRLKNKNTVGQSRSNNRKWSGLPAAFAKEISVMTWYLQPGFEEAMFGKYCSAQKCMRSQRKKDRLLCDALALSALAWASVVEFQGDKPSPPLNSGYRSAALHYWWQNSQMTR